MEDGPAVAMLWESADPGHELTERFGFRDGAAAARWVAATLERRWGLEVTRADRLVISDRNAMAWVEAGGRPLIAKWSAAPRCFPRLEDAGRLVAWLEGEGVPVAAPIAATDGRLLVEVDDEAEHRVWSQLPRPGSRFLLGVLPVVAGDLLDMSAPGQVEDAGAMLAMLHDALARYPGPPSGGGRAPLAQLVHNDFRSANVLHDGSRITAVLDFEEMKVDTRVADLARASVLLATRYRDWGPTDERVRATFLAAYERRARDRLSASERAELDVAIRGNLRSFGWA